ncbi:MAG: exopolyphosphatase [Solirubrobacteraceae bacterium]
MRCGCIDIGSNTTRLLVAELDGGRLHEIAGERVFTSIGAAAADDGSIPAAKIAEVADVVAAQAASAVRHGCERIHAVATAAVRRAPNREDLLATLRRVAGVEVELLTAEREARLTHAGAVAMFGAPGELVAVIDVGGGSTELVVGEWWTSLAVGSSSLTRSCVRCDPPSARCVAALRAAAAQAFSSVRAPQAAIALAVGGSATALLLLEDETLDGASLARVIEELRREPVAEYAIRLGLHPERARMLPAGVALLEQACRLWGGRLRVAAGGVREGVVLELQASAYQ